MFIDITKTRARARQWGMCGACGEGLYFSEEEAHEVMPVWKGGWGSVDNCVILCAKCSKVAEKTAHERSSHASPLDYFPYLYGRGLNKVSSSKKRR